MNSACWPITANGRYWIDIALGTHPCRLMVDTGVTDRAGLVGFDLAPAEYDRLDRSGQLLAAGPRMRQVASGAWVWLRCGFLAAQLLDPVTAVRIGPPVS